MSKILFFTTFWKNKIAINNFLSQKCFIIRSLQSSKFDFEKDSLGLGHCTPFEFSFANSSFTPITIQFPTLRINFTQEKNLVKTSLKLHKKCKNSSFSFPNNPDYYSNNTKVD